MELKGRALFNSLRMNCLKDPTFEVEPWQIEDLTTVSTEALFQRLRDLGIVLEEKSFLLYAENCDSPEELIECLWIDEEEGANRDKGYLIVFELWKRLFPDRASLSIFCDQLDALIALYDLGELEDEAPLEDALLVLEDSLDDTADTEGNAKEVFDLVRSYCAHDLEQFLFNYITDQIDEGDVVYASELVEEFYAYVSDPLSFDCLRARCCIFTDIQEANQIFERILSQLEEEPDVDLLLSIADSLIHRGDVRLFLLALKQAVAHLETEAQFQEILEMLKEHYRCLDREKEQSAVEKMLSSRLSYPADRRFDTSDPMLSQFLKFLKLPLELTEPEQE